jgi:hypothetical protein
MKTFEDREFHELRPRDGRAHETLTVKFIGNDVWLGAINGTWVSGWDFPTEYDHYTDYTKERK